MSNATKTIEYDTLSDVAKGYVTAMFFTEEERLTEEDSEVSTDPHDLPQETLAKVKEVCDEFERSNAHLWSMCHSPRGEFTIGELVGHDLWLTRNGHGSGFWDRPEVYGRRNADLLADRARKLRECYAYVGDDGMIYL